MRLSPAREDEHASQPLEGEHSSSQHHCDLPQTRNRKPSCRWTQPKWDGHRRTNMDGLDWSVLPNWETTKSMVTNILSISYIPFTTHPLETQFAGDFFLNL